MSVISDLLAKYLENPTADATQHRIVEFLAAANQKEEVQKRLELSAALKSLKGKNRIAVNRLLSSICIENNLSDLFTFEDARQTIAEYLAVKSRATSPVQTSRQAALVTLRDKTLPRLFDDLRTIPPVIPSIEIKVIELIKNARSPDQGKSFYGTKDGWAKWKKDLAAEIFKLLMDETSLELKGTIKDSLSNDIKKWLSDRKEAKKITIALLSSYMFFCLSGVHETLFAEEKDFERSLDERSFDTKDTEFHSFSRTLTEIRAKENTEIADLFTELYNQRQAQLDAKTQALQTKITQAQQAAENAILSHFETTTKENLAACEINLSWMDRLRYHDDLDDLNNFFERVKVSEKSPKEKITEIHSEIKTIKSMFTGTGQTSNAFYEILTAIDNECVNSLSALAIGPARSAPAKDVSPKFGLAKKELKKSTTDETLSSESVSPLPQNSLKKVS